MTLDPLKKIEDVAKMTHDMMGRKTRGVFERYPITFSFLILFGVIAVLHGFDALVYKIVFLRDHPLVLFVIGVLILIFTGTLYKKLDKKIH